MRTKKTKTPTDSPKGGFDTRHSQGGQRFKEGEAKTNKEVKDQLKPGQPAEEPQS